MPMIFLEYYDHYFLPLGLMIVLFGVLMMLFRPFLRVGKYRPRELDDETPFPAAVPKASVIVYTSFDDDSELIEYLDNLSVQDYPDFEVIVVCESTASGVESLTEKCSTRYNNVYITFIPPGSHNVSRRKLALTLGMKAAKGDVVVTTVSNAIPASNRWLSTLLYPFYAPEEAEARRNGEAEVEVALGYTHPDYRQMPGAGRWYREFVTLISDVTWIGSALARHPYRGDGYNLAFRRDLFFKHKGYAGSVYLHSGDDDIFIHEVATPENTRMVLHPESILTIHWGEASRRMWTMRKEQYAFTSRWLPRRPFRREAALSACQWLMLVLGAVTILLAYTHPWLWIAPIVALLIFWNAEILLYRGAAGTLQATRLWWAVPIFWLLKPILNFFFRLRHHRHRRKNFTWQR